MSDLARLAGESTPARVFLGSAGLSLRTGDALQLRADHAAARDAVAARFDPDGGPLRSLDGIVTSSLATTPAEHLLRPDLGRRFDEASVAHLLAEGTRGADVQLVIGDGLSPGAVDRHAPAVVDALRVLLSDAGLSTGRPVVVRHCRVGILDHLGDLLDPGVAVLLVGERPGLATNQSMSAYLAHRPRSGRTDADRNCISNIHDRGVPPEVAAARIHALVAEIRRVGTSGVTVKEPDLAPNADDRTPPLAASSDTRPHPIP